MGEPIPGHLARFVEERAAFSFYPVLFEPRIHLATMARTTLSSSIRGLDMTSHPASARAERLSIPNSPEAVEPSPSFLAHATIALARLEGMAERVGGEEPLRASAGALRSAHRTELHPSGWGLI